MCIDLATGKIAHDIKLFDVENPANTQQYNSFASPTPAIEEDRVYVQFGSYGTACLDTHTGKTLWQRRDLPCNHFRGPGSSPMLFENLLLLHFDGFDYQYPIALDKQTGETVWKTDRAHDYGTDDGDMKKAFSTPLVIEAAGRLQMISPCAKAVLAYDPRTGKEIWRVRYPSHSAAARPCVRRRAGAHRHRLQQGRLTGHSPRWRRRRDEIEHRLEGNERDRLEAFAGVGRWTALSWSPTAAWRSASMPRRAKSSGAIGSAASSRLPPIAAARPHLFLQ